MTRVFIWKNNCPQEWEEISFTAFRKARSSGAFSGRFFIETTRMIYDDSDRLIIECSQEQFEKYRHEERHSRYLQEHEGRYLTIPMSGTNGDTELFKKSRNINGFRRLIWRPWRDSNPRPFA